MAPRGMDPRLVELFNLAGASGVKPLTYSQSASLMEDQFNPDEAFTDYLQAPIADLFDTGSVYSQLKDSTNEDYKEPLAQVTEMRQTALGRLADLRRRLAAGERPSDLLQEWTSLTSDPNSDLAKADKGGIGPEAVAAIAGGLTDYAAAEDAATVAPIQNMVTYLLNKGVDPTPALENARRMADYQGKLMQFMAAREAYGPVVDNPMWDSYNRDRR